MSILEYFPTNLYSPRQIQKDILNEIEQLLPSYNKIIISAPTGVGKSAIAISLARYLGSSFVVTASKYLQDQYIKEHTILNPVKGKKNFPCLQIMKSKKVDDPILAMTQEMTCEKGKCEEKKSALGTEYCEFKPKIANMENGEDVSGSCHYYVQKYHALLSDHSVWNYPMFFQLMKYNKKLFAKYLLKGVAVFDEAHKIEDQIINFIGIDITKRKLDDCKIDISRYNISEIDGIIDLLDAMRKFYAQELADMESKKIPFDSTKYSRFVSELDKTAGIIGDIQNDKDNFIISKSYEFDDTFKPISVKPIDISNFVNSFFETECQVFMSATIDKQGFCETMGFNLDEVAFIDTPKSPFDFEHRKVYFENVARLGYNAGIEKELAAISKIDEILTAHSNERGLILTSSIARCYDILKNLTANNKKRIRICHSNNRNGKTQEQILKEHSDDPTGVLLSSSLWEGIDLKGDLSRFQIIAKIPYPPLTDERTKIKRTKYPLWYNSQTIMKLLQGFGRSIRDENDWAKTYVIDSSILGLITRGRQSIPKAYYDILGIS